MAVRSVRACFFEMGEMEAKLVGWQVGRSVGRARVFSDGKTRDRDGDAVMRYFVQDMISQRS